jgi:hypothetical protein
MANELFADRVKDTTTTTGTGNITLAGSPPTGYQSFNTAFGTSVNFCYTIEGGSEWEVGMGHLSASTTLVRDLVLASSNSNALVSFSAGTKNAFCTIPAAQALHLDPLSNCRMTDDFIGNRDTAQGWWTRQTAGGTVTSATLTGESGHPGIVRITVSTTTSGTVAWAATPATSVSSVIPTDFFDLTWVCRPVDNDAQVTYRIGMFQTGVVSAFSDVICFAKEAANNYFTGTCVAASSRTDTSTFGAYTANTWHKFRMRRIDASTIGFKFDEAAEQTITTNIPTAALVPAAYVVRGTSGTKTLDIDLFDLTISGLAR